MHAACSTPTRCFVIGVAGHIYKSRTAVATGIGMIFVATLLLPLGVYLSDR